MNEEFVSFELAKKLKEKGFNCEYPFAMYNKYEQFCPLYSSDKDCFGIDDFDKHACIAPTISQVLKWLREKGIFIEIHVYATFATRNKVAYWFRICRNSNGMRIEQIDELDVSYAYYEKAAMGGIEYCLDNLI